MTTTVASWALKCEGGGCQKRKSYEELADNCGLSNFQKVETIIRYVHCSECHIWMTLQGYIDHNWDNLRNKLSEEYINPSPEGWFSKQKLVDFANKYAQK
jgi:hypothetical protein